MPELFRSAQPIINPHPFARCRAVYGNVLIAAFAGLVAVAAQAGTASASAMSAYQAERAACLDGSSGQERATCLREAAAALAEARQGRLGNGESSGTLADNAQQRCQKVLAEDRSACLRMVRGEGMVSGSVKAGGTMRQITTVTVGPTPAADGSAPAKP